MHFKHSYLATILLRRGSAMGWLKVIELPHEQLSPALASRDALAYDD